MRKVGIDFFCNKCNEKFCKWIISYPISEKELSKCREFRKNESGNEYFCYVQECPKCGEKMDSRWQPILKESPMGFVKSGKFSHLKQLDKDLAKNPMPGDSDYYSTLDKGWGPIP